MKRKVFLVGLTGMGNAALAGLLDCGAEVVGILTLKQKGRFPYYEEEKIERLAENKRIKVFYSISDAYSYVVRFGKKELILFVATYYS